jgi:hypothetical protein
MRPHRVVLLVAAALLSLTCNEPERTMRVAPTDAVQCCFFVPYDGLAGSVMDEQCMPQPVCPRAGEDDAAKVCMPLACRRGDTSPYGRAGPKGTAGTTGSCTFDADHTRIVPGGCPGVVEAGMPRM